MQEISEKKYWTSLDDLTSATKEAPDESDIRSLLNMLPEVNRRSFLKTLGFSLAAGALSGCAKPAEKIIPYANHPPETTPGIANWYATTCHGCTAACGAVAKVMDGRPIKLEGNPDHKISRGGLCAVGQGAVISLYDSYRQKKPAIAGQDSTWERVDAEIVQHLRTTGQQDKKIVVLTGTVVGPSTRSVIQEFLKANPEAEHIEYDAVSYDAIRQAHRQVYGQPITPSLRFDRADVIVSVGADFLGTWLSPVEFTKQYSANRSVTGPHSKMSKHFQFESRMSLTGSNADYRTQIAPSDQAAIVGALTIRAAKVLGVAKYASLPLPFLTADVQKRVDRAAIALSDARGKSLVVSESNEPSTQAAVIALNELLGNVGQTLDLTRPSLQKQGRDSDMDRLTKEMASGHVGAVLVHDCNPAYTYPQADKFVPALQKVPCSVSFTIAPDETSRVTKYHCPTHHPMESWGDAEPQQGRLSLFQPTIRPLHATRAFEDSLLKWSGKNESFYDRLRHQWQGNVLPHQQETSDFGTLWDTMLQRGFIELPTVGSPLKANSAVLLASLQRISKSQSRNLKSQPELEVFESVALRDGSYANNPWLQELPDPVTKITWDNFAAISPILAAEKNIVEGQWIEVTANGNTVKAPAHIQSGQHPQTVSIALGYGRTQAGPAGSGVGANTYPLVALLNGVRQTACSLDNIQLTQSATGERIYRFAQTQTQDTLEGRPIVKESTFNEYRDSRHGKHPAGEDEEKTNLWAEHKEGEFKWGMVIDLTKCTGCSACVTGCDMENNVDVVGRDEVRLTRDMKWMRIDRYYSGGPDDPSVIYQPMLCQHCDNASCESVCPALATVHDDQGLNVQVYNRCVGTRYCANNCPYKVRRFNFWNHSRNDVTENLALNPDVTVRTRGVMEKCSFCIQRVQSARISARHEGRPVKDGEVQTACQQSCPADAIVFGNLMDHESQVARKSEDTRGFRVLEDLNRQPAIRYLAKIRNKESEA